MDNFTIRPVLWKYKPTSTRIYTIKIAVTVDRKTTYILTNHRVHEDHWKVDKVVDHANAKWINADIARLINEKQRDLIALRMQDLPLSKVAIHGGAKTGNRTFKSFAMEIRDHRTDLPRFLNFAGDGVRLRDIDPAMLRKFETFERARVDADGGRCVNDNTISCTMKYIGQIMRQAVKEKLIVENPFDAYHAPTYIDPPRIWLEEEEKELIFKWLEKEVDDTLRTTATYFLLGCFSGLRHSDWAQFNPDTMVNKAFLKIRATKNNQDVIMPVGPTLQRVIEMTRAVGRPQSLEKCNLHLKFIGPSVGIKKSLSTHVGRHSFGYLCASLGLPKSVTAELMGVTVKTVEVYYHLTGQNIIKQAAAMAGV